MDSSDGSGTRWHSETALDAFVTELEACQERLLLADDDAGETRELWFSASTGVLSPHARAQMQRVLPTAYDALGRAGFAAIVRRGGSKR